MAGSLQGRQTALVGLLVRKLERVLMARIIMYPPLSLHGERFISIVDAATSHFVVP
jgi:hypothetical protein